MSVEKGFKIQDLGVRIRQFCGSVFLLWRNETIGMSRIHGKGHGKDDHDFNGQDGYSKEEKRAWNLGESCHVI